MGYTNYWTIKENVEEFSQEFVTQCEMIAKASGVKLGNYSGEVGTQPIFTNNTISLNGSEEDGGDYESFNLRVGDDWNCCKTARLPYDKVIKAILMLADKYGYLEKWSFDGNETEEEYLDALNLFNSLNFEIEPMEGAVKTFEVDFTVHSETWKRYGVAIVANSKEEAEELALEKFRDGELEPYDEGGNYDCAIDNIEVEEV